MPPRLVIVKHEQVRGKRIKSCLLFVYENIIIGFSKIFLGETLFALIKVGRYTF